MNNYVYNITEINTGMQYIGSRSCNIPIQSDIGIKYKSSSTNKEFIDNQNKNPNNYIYTILSIHNTRYEADIEEHRLHIQYNVVSSNLFYNKSIGGFKYICGMTAVKDQYNNKYYVGCDDQRVLSGEFVGINKGKVVVKDIYNNISQVDITNQDYINGILKHISVGRVTVKDPNNYTLSVFIDNPLYKSGYYKFICTGKFNAKDEYGNIFHIDKEHPDFINGKLIPFFKGKVVTKDINNNIHHVKCGDPRITSGELQYYCSGLKHGPKSEVAKNKISNALKGKKLSNETKNKISNTLKGRRLSNDTREKMSISRKGRIFSAETLKKMSMAQSLEKNPSAKKVSINGVVFGCITSASKILNVNRSTVTSRLKSNIEKYKDWIYL